MFSLLAWMVFSVFTYPGLVLAKAWHVSLQTAGSDRGTLAISDFARCLPLQVAGPFFLSRVSCNVKFSIPWLLVPKSSSPSP